MTAPFFKRQQWLSKLGRVPRRLWDRSSSRKASSAEEQLDLALKIKDVQPDKYLGEILFQIGVPQEKINRALYYFRKRKTIGEILIDQELISSEQLEEALSKQKNIKEKQGCTKPLGLLLIEMGYINVAGYLRALSKHFNMPILTLNNFDPSSHLPESHRRAIRHGTQGHRH